MSIFIRLLFLFIQVNILDVDLIYFGKVGFYLLPCQLVLLA